MGRKVLILTHRRELFHQTGNLLFKDGIDYGRINADHPNDPTLPIQIAMVQSLYSQAIRRKKISMPKSDLVICDEFHRAGADIFQKIHDQYPEAFIVGFTATPVRQNGRGLAECADELIVGLSISELTKQGYLVPAKYYAPAIGDLLKGIKIRSGDYVEKELDERVNKTTIIGDICENWSRICPDRQTLTFGVSVAHSQHIADTFNSLGIKAAHIDGKTPERERDRFVDHFRKKEIRVLCSCMVFVEGFDVPEASCLILARPTKSLGLFLQMAGRGLRIAPGKTDCVFLDHVGNLYEHGMLDQDFQWSLDYGRKKTINKVMKKKKDKELKRWITCEKCSFVFTGRIDCPNCGMIAKAKGKPVETFEAYLKELAEDEKHKYITEEKAVWWAAFKFEAMKKYDYKQSSDGQPARAYALYQEKFRCWPRGFNKNIAAKEGPLDVQAWINHSKIRWLMRNKNRQVGIAHQNGNVRSNGLEKKLTAERMVVNPSNQYQKENARIPGNYDPEKDLTKDGWQEGD